MEYITLNNRIEIPQLGLGTYLLEPNDAQAAVSSALGMGYELIDTANAYVNERAVGRGMRDSKLERENTFSKQNSGLASTTAKPPLTKRSNG